MSHKSAGGEQRAGLHEALDPDGDISYPVGMDPSTKSLRVNLWKWDTVGLTWVRWDGRMDTIVSGDLIVAVDNLEQYVLDQLHQYKLSNFDVSADPIYLGYLNKSGAWYIRQITLSTGAILYAVGSSGYAAAWATASGQSYDVFSEKF